MRRFWESIAKAVIIMGLLSCLAGLFGCDRGNDGDAPEDIRTDVNSIANGWSAIQGYYEEATERMEIRGDQFVFLNKGSELSAGTLTIDGVVGDCQKVYLSLDNNGIHNAGDTRIWGYVTNLYYDASDDSLHYTLDYDIIGTRDYQFKRTQDELWGNIIIRDDEFLPQLQGKWKSTVEWNKAVLEFQNDQLTVHWGSEADTTAIHVVSYRGSSKVMIVNADFRYMYEVAGYFTSYYLNADGTISCSDMVYDAPSHEFTFIHIDE